MDEYDKIDWFGAGIVVLVIGLVGCCVGFIFFGSSSLHNGVLNCGEQTFEVTRVRIDGVFIRANTSDGEVIFEQGPCQFVPSEDD